MSVLDCVEVWVVACSELLTEAGVVVEFVRSDADRLNPSCSVHLVRGTMETDLVVWDSGEAELALVAADGSVAEEHIEGLGDPAVLIDVLQRSVRGFLPA